MVDYERIVIVNSRLLGPLHQLLRKDSKCMAKDKNRRDVVSEIQEALIINLLMQVFVHFDPKKPLHGSVL